MLGATLTLALAAFTLGVSAKHAKEDFDDNNACEIARNAAKSGIGSHLKPSEALACLASVPLARDHDMELMDYLGPYVEQQSTIGILKNPPETYLLPAIDLVGGLRQIKDKISAGGYKSQLEFTWDVNRMWNQLNDGHFDYKPALLQVFGFQSSRGLKSVSKDGLELPEIYDEDDLQNSRSQGFTPSAVVSVDGIPVVDYLQIVASAGALQDPDAQYNNLFTTTAARARGGGGYFRSGGYTELPDISIYKYANGTVASHPNYAILRQDLTGISNGRQLHLAYEIPPPKDSGKQKDKKKSSSSPPINKPTVPGYPLPVVKHYNDYVAGYFMNGSEYQDVAVLSIYSFTPKPTATKTDSEFVEFRRVVREFIEQCRREQRTKLILDLQANGGGMLHMAFELYRNLFPRAEPFDGTRIRATDAYNIIGKVDYGTPKERNVVNNPLDQDLKRYQSWEALWGPVNAKEDKMTNLLRYNFKSNTTVGEGDFYISGYGPNDTPPEPYFEGKNILIVSDGFCASTCTVISRLLINEQGARSLALGGRPLKAPMQTIGGVKGAQVVKFQLFQDLLKDALQKVPKDTKLPDNLPKIANVPLLPSLSKLSFNFRNAYESADSLTPLQFLYEAAHCRRFYTDDMTRKPVEVWKVAVDVAFRGGKCVEGSSIGANNTMGDRPKFDRAKVVSRLAPYNGPGSKAYTDSNLNRREFVGSRVSVARRRSEATPKKPVEALSDADKALLDRELVNDDENWWDHKGI
ncbi:hypothetical protein MCOR34_003978 [Pyricularia oryzae]|uniref:Uncharacterized protein n=1 Tax=Pyricularia oryzae TaxID=318829 RepID=A0A4P7MY90_PYROR|nr:hypothetical protein MCOR34_003978 [Pyricularia oryzae]KAI6598215.1 hypothetical protein MCOR04_002660 [Pyricularia oryzae]QBZ54062.1 hypothetical protein PoMZ_09753 [Pyricularia oryzae]